MGRICSEPSISRRMKEDKKNPAPLEETGLDKEVQTELETDLKNIISAAEHGDKEAAKSAALHLVHTTQASFSGPSLPLPCWSITSELFPMRLSESLPSLRNKLTIDSNLRSVN